MTGKKALVFVRRVRSVDELKRKLDEKYDEWLIQTLREQLPQSVAARFDEVVRRYTREKRERHARTTLVQTADTGEDDLDTVDRGGCA